MAVKKKIVHQVAKEFNISVGQLVSFLRKMNLSVTPNSPIDEEVYAAIQEKFDRDVKGVDSEHTYLKKLKERHREEQLQLEKKKLSIEERLRISQQPVKQPAKKKEPSKEEVLKIAEKQAIEEAQKELRRQRQAEKDRQEKMAEAVEAEAVPAEVGAKEDAHQPPVPVDGREEISSNDKHPTDRIEAKGVSTDIESVTEAPPAPPEEAVQTEAPPEKPKPEKGKARRKKAEEAEKRKKKDKKAGLEIVEEEPTEETARKKKKRRKKKKKKISEEEIEAKIKETLKTIDATGRPKRRRKKVKTEDGEVEVEESNVIKVTEFISVADLAELMDVEPTEVLKKCLELGLMVTINQRLDMDTIIMVADEFGFEVEQEEEFAADLLEEDEEDREEDLQPRPPVVTIMGHVDHGKTSLLDYIRRSNIIAGEAGGITQHIGAYEVTVNGKQITFLDTPGHEAFTAMRARGAQVTDIVVLIVAADDGVQQQTIEAINHAKAAGVPIIVAINKIDRPEANPDMVKQQLSQHGILVEDWGGKYQCVEISAKKGLNVDKLLDAILLEAEVLELKANPNKLARGTVIEAELDRGKGPVGTVLVQTGTMRVGDPFVAGLTYGKVRAMLDERGNPVKEAPPSTPVRVIGFSAVPQAGDRFIVMKSEKEAREISIKRQQIYREQEMRKVKMRTLDQISKQIQEGEVRELRVIVKGDVDGSVEAISDALLKLSTDEVAVEVIHKGVGGITETDVNLAAASDAIIIGFNVRVTLQARELAEKEDVDIRTYRVIYDAIEDVKAALEGLLQPELKEEVTGTAEIRQVFKVPKVGKVAGCYVLSGKIRRTDNVRLYREDKLIYEGKIGSLKRFKEDVREVQAGFECGLSIEGFDDIHVGDVVECYQVTEIKRSLD